MRSKKFFSQIQLHWLIIILILGLLFRCVNLGDKIYWVDEVATSLRVSGYTHQEFVREISQKSVIPISEFQQYQQPGNKPFRDTINALTQSPEHAPLYFLLVKLWMHIFGSSVVAVRSFSVVFSLLSLPCIYALCRELFQCHTTGKVAVALLSVSPFYVAYAQEARPYSLWLVAILLSSWTLLKALRTNEIAHWGLYILSLILAFYTSLLSIFMWVAQTVYVGMTEGLKLSPRLKKYAIASGLSFVGFAPWLWVTIDNWDRLQENTVWMRVPLELFFMMILWIYNTFIVFVESPISLDASVIPRMILDFNLLLLVIAALVCLCRRTPPKTWLYILCLIVVHPTLLILVDLVVGGQSSVAARYIVPYHVGIILAVAHFFGYQLKRNKMATPKARKIWQIILTFILFVGIFSCIYLLNTSPKYQKTRNISNVAIAQIINRQESPAVIAERSQLLDILSLSYLLKPDTQIYLAEPFDFSIACQSHFLFNPSQALQTQLREKKYLKLEQIYQPELLISSEIHLSLWTVKNPEQTCHNKDI